MFLIHDIRQSRAYQEAREEGLKKGFGEGIEKGAAIVRLASKKKSVEEIAAIVEVNAEIVRRVLAQADGD